MAVIFEEVIINELNEENLTFIKRFGGPLAVEVIDESDNLLLRCKQLSDNSPQNSLCDIQLFKDSETALFGKNGFIITDNGKTILLLFNKTNGSSNNNDLTVFNKLVYDFKYGRKVSVFSSRTDESSASQYFQFYGYLSQQQNMMQDYIRTSTYQRAILANIDDFKDKVVLDVGAGSGILSFFAAQAGARKVYAVEASSMAKHAETLVFQNKLNDRIFVIPGKIEEINLSEMVDVIISEPMGYMLFNERMLETYLHAKKWLKPNGKMFPSRGDLHIAPFNDAQLYTEQVFIS
jgi:histone-arginine methyltransferase CARM1